MSIDETYDRWAARLDPSVAVVTLTDGREHAGCLVGFHGQVSIAPRRHGIWISTANHSYGVARRAVAAAVHLLGADDADLAERFGHLTGDRTDKFAGLAHRAGPGGVRLLDRLPDRVAGRCSRPHEVGGDHVLLVLRPEEGPEPGAALDRPLRLADVAHITPGHPDPP